MTYRMKHAPIGSVAASNKSRITPLISMKERIGPIRSGSPRQVRHQQPTGDRRATEERHRCCRDGQPQHQDLGERPAEWRTACPTLTAAARQLSSVAAVIPSFASADPQRLARSRRTSPWHGPGNWQVQTRTGSFYLQAPGSSPFRCQELHFKPKRPRREPRICDWVSFRPWGPSEGTGP